MWKLLIIISLTLVYFVNSNEEKQQEEQGIWEQDLSESFKIDASTKGLERVHLKCNENSIELILETNDDFNGVMYTRGSYHKQLEPCFIKTKYHKGSRIITMKFNLDQCQTLHENNVYSNVVVIQHDEELVTPGDSAFSLVCDYNNLEINEINDGDDEIKAKNKQAISSRITLTSPDPSSVSPSINHHHQTVVNNSNIVTFMMSEIDVNTAKGTVESVNLGIRSENDL